MILISVLSYEYVNDDVTIRLVLIAFHNSSRNKKLCSLIETTVVKYISAYSVYVYIGMLLMTY